MDNARTVANRCVTRLLDEKYSSPEDFNSRPGGKNDPHRQVTLPLMFKAKDFIGKRGKKPAKKSKDDEPVDIPIKSRFNLKFSEARHQALKGR